MAENLVVNGTAETEDCAAATLPLLAVERNLALNKAWRGSEV
jgi:hypothetical protein